MFEGANEYNSHSISPKNTLLVDETPHNVVKYLSYNELTGKEVLAPCKKRQSIPLF
jgi:hypothetical protein